MPPDTPGPSVLLVDGQPDHRFLLASSLREALPQCRLGEAGTVEEALAALQGGDYDVLLSDYHLSDATGVHLLQTLRERGLDTAFVLVTGHGSEDVARQAFVAGAADYVTKESAFRNSFDLARRVRRALEERRLNAERRRSETLVESFLENNPFAIAIFDDRGRIVRWNRALLALENHPEDLDRLQSAYCLFEDVQLREAGVLDQLLQAYAGRCVEIAPFPWDPGREGLQGPIRIFQGVAFPIQAGGGPGGSRLCVMFRDVTAEETARRERDQYQAILAGLLNASNTGILFADPDGTVRFANRDLHKFFDLRPEDFDGTDCLELARRMGRATADPDAFLRGVRHLCNHLDRSVEDLVEILRPRRLHLRRHGGPVRSPDGRILGRIEVYTDDTELKEKQQVLEERNRELDAFAARLSHDLKTPLVSLKGFADLLHRQHLGQLDERGRLYLEKLQAAAGILGEMVDALRELAHSGEQTPCAVTNDPLSVLRLTVETLGAEVSERGVEVHLPEAVPPVRCDRTRLFQIFQNLISNAVRYADPHKPSRWVAVEAEPEDGEVAFRVADNGLGMDPEELQVMFQPFRRGRHADTQAGMGLGLAITQRIVQACGGRIKVRSDLGEGTCFTVILPRNQGDACPTASPDHPG